MTDNLPTNRPQTEAQIQRDQMDQLVNLLISRTGQFEALLADANIDVKLFYEGVRRALMRNPDLMRANRADFLQAAMNCAADGLIPDGRDAVLVIRKGRVTYDPMYQGMLKVAYRSGLFSSIEARVVFEGDEYEYTLGITPEVHHRPRGLSRKVIGAYAVAKTVNGGVFFEPLTRGDLDAIKRASQAKSGPWGEWEDQMSRAKAVRRLWKFIPRSRGMESLAATIASMEELDAPVSRPSLNMSAAPAALSAPVAEERVEIVMDTGEVIEAVAEASTPIVAEAVSLEPQTPEPRIVAAAETIRMRLSNARREADLKAVWVESTADLKGIKNQSQDLYEMLVDKYDARLKILRQQQ